MRWRMLFILTLCLPFVGGGSELQWRSGPGYRFAPVTVVKGGGAGFTQVSSAVSGIRFTNHLASERHYANQILLNGSGVAAGDIDGDGLCDLFFCGLEGRSAFYRNRGDWRFEDYTAGAGPDFSRLDATGAVMADVDGDDDLDLIVNSVGQGTFCLVNDGQGHFSMSPVSPVLNTNRCGSSLALGDVDGDGDLDLYIANYRVTTIRDAPHLSFTFREVNGRPQAVAFGGKPLTDPDLVNRFAFRYQALPGGGGNVLHDELGEADVFYRNLGRGQFEEISFTAGGFRDEKGQALAQPPYDWGLSVAFRDLNRDGAPDLYVCNDFSSPDRIWINQGDGRFRAIGWAAIRKTSLSTMAVDFADLNGDGYDDLLTADMLSRERWRRLVQQNEPNPNIGQFIDSDRRPQAPRNMVQLSRGDGTYAEVACLAGLESSEWAWTSLFLDVDLDGREDLLVANGFERDYMNMDANRRIRMMESGSRRRLSLAERRGLNRVYPRLATPNQAFRNLGNLRFEEVGAGWGFDVAAVSQGMCLADLDNDGDLDVVINNLNDEPSLLQNRGRAPRVAVRLKGRPPNTRGIGARMTLLADALPSQSQEMIAGGRYLSSDDAMRVFAAGNTTGGMSLRVTWRSGVETVITNLSPNHVYEVIEPAHGTPALPSVASSAAPLFANASELLNHMHTPVRMDDFARQYLLPYKLSELGPGVGWFDVDADGWEDLLLPGGRGSEAMVLTNRKGEGFLPRPLEGLKGIGNSEQVSMIGVRQSAGDSATVHAAVSTGSGQESQLRRSGIDAGQVETVGMGDATIVGAMTAADLDGDGGLELFVGGRYVEGTWPAPVSSRIYRRVDGMWTPDPANSAILDAVGLVGGVVCSDLDGDADPDLIVACEWGPIRIFRNDRGRLAEWDWALTLCCGKEWPVSRLEELTGRWNGITAGDFDGDGRMDLAASNWGRNTMVERFRSRPPRIYFGELNGDPEVEIVETCYDELIGRYAPILNIWTLSRSLPWLLGRFSTHEAFARVGIEEALGERFKETRFLEALWPDHTVFLNRGTHFEAHSLPLDAQFAPAFGISAADFDGDGLEDLFLAQNFFGLRKEFSRLDAGRGLVLIGKGDGSFRSLTGQESGVTLYGEQRGAAVGDFDHDGRVDLVVAEFGGVTSLFRNETGTPGVRVRLRGPAGNPDGIGAVLRVTSEAGLGAAREIHAGSGYWSQDSAVPVMSLSSNSKSIWVRWPWGKTSEIAIPPDAREVTVRHPEASFR